MVRRCQSQEQATENDLREFQQQRKPSTQTGKCLHACLMESIGLVKNDLKFKRKRPVHNLISVLSIQMLD